MASMNNAIPMLPKHFDLKDAVDKTDRLLEVAQQISTQLQGQIYPLVIDPALGTVYTTPPAPAWVTSPIDNSAAYKLLLTNGTLSTLIAAIDTEYGLYELAAALQFKLQQIAALNAGNISNVA
jgi:hypothetical protein